VKREARSASGDDLGTPRDNRPAAPKVLRQPIDKALKATLTTRANLLADRPTWQGKSV